MFNDSDRGRRLDELTLPGGIPLSYADARRNIVTRGVGLNSLVGQRFKIGSDVQCIDRRPCEPCAHLERVSQPGVLRHLSQKGGLRPTSWQEASSAKETRSSYYFSPN